MDDNEMLTPEEQELQNTEENCAAEDVTPEQVEDDAAKTKSDEVVDTEAAIGAIAKTDSYSEDELAGELEKLRSVFSDEYEKAREKAEADGGILIQELDEIKEEIEAERIPEEMLCHCCGERERDTSVSENYEYCSVCREGMKHYPIGFQYLLLAVAVIAFSVLSSYFFMMQFGEYSDVKEADELAKAGKTSEAVELYESVVTGYSDLGLSPERIVLKSVELVYDTPVAFSQYTGLVAKMDGVLSAFEYRLPWNKKYYDMRQDIQLFSATMDNYYSLAEQYSDLSAKELPYDEIIASLDALIGKTVSIGVPSSSGDKTEEVTYDEAAVRFCQYLFSNAVDKDEEAGEYLMQVREKAPEKTWLYGYELGMHYVKSGEYDEALEMQKLITAQNASDPYNYILEMNIYRLKKDYDKVKEVYASAQDISGFHSELDRQLAIVMLLEGKYTDAVDMLEGLINGSKTESIYLESVFTYAVAAHAANDSDSLEYIEGQMTEYGVEYSDRVTEYFNGELTLEQLFLEGICDVV